MLKRTKGSLLLALLVITGLAGTYVDNTISKEDRKQAVKELKFTRDEVLKTVSSLNETQLTYKAAPDKWSVQECLFHITLAEKTLWNMIDTAMKQPAKPADRALIQVSDSLLKTMMTDRTTKRQAADPIQPARATWTNSREALRVFKDLRADHIRYVRTTTEDLRDHILDMPFGKIDAYQMILVVNGHTARHFAQITEILGDPGFPK